MIFFKITIFLDFSRFFLNFSEIKKIRKKVENVVQDPCRADVVALPCGSATAYDSARESTRAPRDV